MRNSLIKIEIVKNEGKKGKCTLKVECNWSKYISKATASKARTMVEKIYKELSDELVLVHLEENIPLFHLKEEAEGIYLESPYVDFIRAKDEYQSCLDSVIFSVKRDYAAFCMKRKRDCPDKLCGNL